MRTRKSLVFSFLDRYASLAIVVVSSMLVARLLTPEEIGIFSVTMVLLTFVSTLRDMGAGQYLVQEKELTHARIRAVWAVQLGLGVGLAGFVLIASRPIAMFYNEPRMHDILLVVALNYLVNPFGSLTYAWLMREMRFDNLAMMRFVSALVGASVSAILAWQGFGPISLAWGSLATTTANASLAVYYRPKDFPWFPGISEIRRVLAFGSQLTFSSIVTVAYQSVPELLIGKLQGLTAAGYYSRASGLVQMFHRLFVDAVGAVCLPWFAKHAREQGGMVEPFLKATSYVTAFGWSFCFFVLALAHPLMIALYGGQWHEAVDATRLLAVAMAFLVPASLCPTAMMSAGAARQLGQATLASALQSVVWAAVGASYGLTGLASAMIMSALFSSLIWVFISSRKLNFTVWTMCRSLWKSMAVALASAIGPFAALMLFGRSPEALAMPLAVGTIGALLGFLLGIFAVSHPLKEEILSVWDRLSIRTASNK